MREDEAAVAAGLALAQQIGQQLARSGGIGIARQIEATDRQIDRLVYELYGLTEEEIGIVEAVAK